MTDRLKHLRLLLLDVDGVLTDGSITYSDSGEQIKTFNARDGLGLRLLMDAGIEVGIVTARVSGALGHRCENLGISLVFDGVKDKARAFDRITGQTGIPAQDIGYMGDDLLDLPAMTRAGVAFTVADAPEEVKQQADVISDHPGGRGAVRQVCEAILKARGSWDDILSGYLG